MAEYATKGVAGTGLGLGIAGTALGLLGGLGGNSGGGLGGLIGGLLGGNQNPNMGLADYAVLANAIGSGFGGYGMYNSGCGCAPVCNEDHHVNRYEAGKDARIAELETEVKLRDANVYTLGQMNDMRNYVDGQFREIRDSLCGQAVINQRTADSFERVHDDLMCVKGNLEGQIAAERAARCCSDSQIVSYVNATFYPKLVSDIVPGTTTTAQVLYNPVTNCGCCGCGN